MTLRPTTDVLSCQTFWLRWSSDLTALEMDTLQQLDQRTGLGRG